MTNPTTPSHALLFAFASALSGALGCVSNGSDAATGGTGGATGGSSSSTGGSTSATGGSGGQNSTGAIRCPKATVALISDFTYVDGAAEKATASFGDYTETFSGGTFVYPPATATYPLTSDITKGNWHVTGTIGDYSGMGLFFSAVPSSATTGGCTLVDASAFKGIQFTISGSIPMGNAVNLQIGTAANDVSVTWLNAHKAMATDPDKPPSFSRCTPLTANQYDGSCSASSKSVAVGGTPTPVKLLWSDFTGGAPEAALNPAEIVFITWILPTPAGPGTSAPTTYVADVTIDDLQFVP